jgi:hypothetical protein
MTAPYWFGNFSYLYLSKPSAKIANFINIDNKKRFLLSQKIRTLKIKNNALSNSFYNP